MGVSNYEILSDKFADALQVQVAAAITAGKQPYGPPFVTPDGKIAQAVAVGSPTVANIASATDFGTLAAAGEDETDAAQITASRTMVTGADGVKGAILPTWANLAAYLVINDAAAANLNIYPDEGNAINDLEADAAFVVGPGQAVLFTAFGEGQWYGSKAGGAALVADSLTALLASLGAASPGEGENILELGECLSLKRFKSEITLSTEGATTATGLTPGGVVLSAGLVVSEAIAGLDSADHHIQLGVSGTTDKYADVANGSSATSIAKNKKGGTSSLAGTKEAAELILTITGGSDQTPTAGKVIVEAIYLAFANLADVP